MTDARATLQQADQAIKEAEKLLHSIGYVAWRCGVSRQAVRRWIRGGKVNAVRLPSGYFKVSPEELARILSQK